MEKISVTAEPIQLDQFLKLAGVIASGGQVKGLIEAKYIKINGIFATERRKKLHFGDVVEVSGEGSFEVAGA